MGRAHCSAPGAASLNPIGHLVEVQSMGGIHAKDSEDHDWLRGRLATVAEWAGVLALLVAGGWTLIRAVLDQGSLTGAIALGAIIMIAASIMIARPWVSYMESQGTSREWDASLTMFGWWFRPGQPVAEILIVAPDGLSVWTGFPRYRHKVEHIAFETVQAVDGTVVLVGPLSRPLPSVAIRLGDGREVNLIVWSKWLLWASRVRRDRLLKRLQQACADAQFGDIDNPNGSRDDAQ